MKQLFTSIPNRVKAIYISWVGIHFTLLIFSGNFLLKTPYRYGYVDDAFFPFRAYWRDSFFDLNVYDFKEFIFYLLIPVIIYYVIKLWKIKDNKA